MRHRIFYLLIEHLAFTRFIFFLYYSHISRGAIANLTLSNGLEKSISGFKQVSNLLDGGASVKAVSSVQVARGVIANLEKDFGLPAYKPPLKIMLLGDSITSGIIGTKDREGGGYRTELWNKCVADGLKVEFVGSRSTGPDSLGNKYHEGHPGWIIRQIAVSVNEWLDTYQPDLILLMIGTNDTKKSSLKIMLNELSALIDQITSQLPNAQLLVASIPPIHPVARPALRALRAIYFNAAIPSILKSKVAQGKKVDFVDMRSLTLDDLTSSQSPDLDTGLHPNAQGYSKIANFWYDAVLAYYRLSMTRS